MPAIAEIIDRATLPAEASVRFWLFARTADEGDTLYRRLTGTEGAGVLVSRNQLLELTVERTGRAWLTIEAAFAAARDVAEAYGLPACEPDIAVGVMPDDPGRASERGL